MHVGLGRQLKEAKAIQAEEDAPIDCSVPYSQEVPKKKFLEVVLLAALGVRKCQGCKQEIIRTKVAHPPIDLIFCMQVLQIWKDQKTKEWCHYYGNIYFHLTMSCAQKHRKEITIEDVSMSVDAFTLLMHKHCHFLCQKGLLKIIAARLQ